jgi:hypothetical protein
MPQLFAHSLSGVGLLLLCMFATGCESSFYGWQVRTNSTLTAPTFLPTNLERQTIGMFGAVTTPVLQGTEIGLSHILGQIIQEIAPDMKVLSPQELAQRINRSGLAGEYARMRADYWQSDILDSDSLRKIASAIGVRYVFQPRLAAFSQTMAQRWQAPAVLVWLTWVRSAIMRASLQLWDAETGELVWHSYAEATVQNEAVSQDPVYFEEIARVTMASMISDLRNGKKSSTYTPMDKLLDGIIQKKEPRQDQTPALDE